MANRIISAVIGLPFSIFIIILGGNVFNLFVFLITLIALYEFYNGLKNAGFKPITSIGYISVGILFLILTLDLSLILPYFLLLVFICFLTLIFVNVSNIDDISLSFFGIFYIGMLFGSIILLRQSNYGEILTFYLLILSWGTDTFAFFTGKLVGKHKLIPRVSPNKTIEGAIGGLIFSALLSVIFMFVVGQEINIQMPNNFILLVIGLTGSVFSQFGDLSASAIKRKCNIKDFGEIIPGHGGILDRFDGLIFTSAYLYIMLFIYNRFMFM